MSKKTYFVKGFTAIDIPKTLTDKNPYVFIRGDIFLPTEIPWGRPKRRRCYLDRLMAKGGFVFQKLPGKIISENEDPTLSRLEDIEFKIEPIKEDDYKEGIKAAIEFTLFKETIERFIAATTTHHGKRWFNLRIDVGYYENIPFVDSINIII